MPDERPLTDAEKQRISFAYGNAAIDNPNITREMVEQAARTHPMTDPAAGDELAAIIQKINWLAAESLGRIFGTSDDAQLRELLRPLIEQREHELSELREHRCKCLGIAHSSRMDKWGHEDLIAFYKRHGEKWHEQITQLRTDLTNETKRANQWSTRHTELVERLTKAVVKLEIAPEDQARSTGEGLLVSSLVGEIRKLRTWKAGSDRLAKQHCELIATSLQKENAALAALAAQEGRDG